MAKFESGVFGIDVAMHTIVTAAIDHYYRSVFEDCRCRICIAVGRFENLISEEDLATYFEMMKERLLK